MQTANFQIKLSDFVFSIKLNKLDNKLETLSKTNLFMSPQNPLYQAPEILL